MKRRMPQRAVPVSPRFEALEPRVLLDGEGPPFCTEGWDIHEVDVLWATIWPDWPESGPAPGAGVKVGVISDGVANAWRIQGDPYYDLPATITIDTGQDWEDGDEGTAMLEIIHDLAPGAQLYFSGPSSNAEMVDSIQWMVQQHVDIIVDDLWSPNEPFFEDGPVAQAAVDAIGAGVVYVSAAGNWAEVHYQDTFLDNGQGYHLFVVDPEHPENNDIRLGFDVPAHTDFAGVLQWNDKWGLSDNDFDLYLDGVPQDPRIVQDGDDDPCEVFEGTNTSEDPMGYAWNVNWAGQGAAPARELEIYTYLGAGPSHPTDAPDSISGQAAADGVIAVAASDAATWGYPGYVEYFSSKGPSTVWTHEGGEPASRQERQSLDLTGVDGVPTCIAWLDHFNPDPQEPPVPFYGTSAAAPHIAGIAALLRDLNPQASVAAIREALWYTAIDMDGAGYDHDTGYGLADAYAAAQALNRNPVAVDDWAWTLEDVPVDIYVLTNDYDPDTPNELSIESVGSASHGTVQINGTQVTYTPASDYVGDDSFQYTVEDNWGATDTATVYVSVYQGAMQGITTTVDLDASADTGWYDDDDVTKLDNSASGEELTFKVYGTVSGATVTVYADAFLIGQAQATGSPTTVVTNGSYDLADGDHDIVARQVLNSQVSESDPLTITIDTQSPEIVEDYPILNEGGYSVSGLDTIDIRFSENVSGSVAVGDLSFYHYDESGEQWDLLDEMDEPDYDYDSGTDTGTWSNIGLSPLSEEPGWYCAVLSREGVTDLAGNELAGQNYVLFVLLAGDANGDYLVNVADLGILGAHYGQQVSGGAQEGDFNGDGWCNVADLGILGANYGLDFRDAPTSLPDGAGAE